jgi:myo-inositol 2-dehydrogenase / D-chiro-inositol 1-dehydrogenase
MRIAVLGAGRIGTFHAELLARSPDVAELLVGDTDPGRGRALADKVGARHVEDLAAVVATGPLDAVVIATPTVTHAGLIHTALEAGIAVFCEKPIALGVPATREVIDHAAAAGVPLQVGFQRRFDAGYRAARNAYRSGTLGRVHTLRAITADPAPPHSDYIRLAGGQFRDMHIHDFDAIRFVTGREVVTVLAVGSNVGADFFREAGDVDTTAAILTLDDGALAVVTGTRYNGAGCDVRLELVGTTGTLVAGLDDHTPLRSAEPDVPWPFETPYQGFLQRFATAYQTELADFLDYARGRIDCPCSAEDALAALLVAEAAELSRLEGRPVTITEVDR